MEIVDLFGEQQPKKEKKRQPGKSNIVWVGVSLSNWRPNEKPHDSGIWLRMTNNLPEPLTMCDSANSATSESAFITALRQAFDLVDKKKGKLPSQILVESNEFAAEITATGLNGDIPIFINEAIVELRREMEQATGSHGHGECDHEHCDHCDHCDGAHEGPHVDYLFPDPVTDGISVEMIRDAYKAFHDLYKLAPWKEMTETELWMFRSLATENETEYWGYLIGFAGQEFGLVLHSSIEQLMSLRAALDTIDFDENPQNLNLPSSISVQFDLKEEFPQEFSDFFQTFAPRWLKEKRWPVIISINHETDSDFTREAVVALGMASQMLTSVVKLAKKEKRFPFLESTADESEIRIGEDVFHAHARYCGELVTPEDEDDE